MNEVLVVAKNAAGPAMRLHRLELLNCTARCTSPATHFVVFLCASEEAPTTSTFEAFRSDTSSEDAERLAKSLPPTIRMLAYFSNGSKNATHEVDCPGAKGVYLAVKFLRGLRQNIDFCKIRAKGSSIQLAEVFPKPVRPLAGDITPRPPAAVSASHGVALSVLAACLSDDVAGSDPAVGAIVVRAASAALDGLAPGALFADVITPVLPPDAPVPWAPKSATPPPDAAGATDPSAAFSLQAGMQWSASLASPAPLQRVTVRCAAPPQGFEASDTSCQLAVEFRGADGPVAVVPCEAAPSDPTALSATVPATLRASAMHSVCVRAGTLRGSARVLAVEARAPEPGAAVPTDVSDVAAWLRRAAAPGGSDEHRAAAVLALLSYARASALPSAALTAVESALLLGDGARAAEAGGEADAGRKAKADAFLTTVGLAGLEALADLAGAVCTPGFSVSRSTPGSVGADKSAQSGRAGVCVPAVFIPPAAAGFLRLRLPHDAAGVTGVGVTVPAPDSTEPLAVVRGPFPSGATLAVVIDTRRGSLTVLDGTTVLGTAAFSPQAVLPTLYTGLGPVDRVPLLACFPPSFTDFGELHSAGFVDAAAVKALFDSLPTPPPSRLPHSPARVALSTRDPYLEIRAPPRTCRVAGAIALPAGPDSSGPALGCEIMLRVGDRHVWSGAVQEGDAVSFDAQIPSDLQRIAADAAAAETPAPMVLTFTTSHSSATAARPLIASLHITAHPGVPDRPSFFSSEAAELAVRAAAFVGASMAQPDGSGEGLLAEATRIASAMAVAGACAAQADAVPGTPLPAYQPLALEPGTSLLHAVARVLTVASARAGTDPTAAAAASAAVTLAAAAMRRVAAIGAPDASVASAGETAEEVEAARAAVCAGLRGVAGDEASPASLRGLAAAALHVVGGDATPETAVKFAESARALAFVAAWPCDPGVALLLLRLQVAARAAGAQTTVTGEWGGRIGLVLDLDAVPAADRAGLVGSMKAFAVDAGLGAVPPLRLELFGCPAKWSDTAALSDGATRISLFSGCSAADVVASFE